MQSAAGASGVDHRVKIGRQVGNGRAGTGPGGLSAVETQDVQALPGDAWVLALTSSASQLTCFLSDTRARFEHASATWPPTGETALPSAIFGALSQNSPAALRLQLDGNLDGWPWEDELE